MTQLRRGFKAQSERRAVELRRTLGISDVGPLSAEHLAGHLCVTIWSAADVPGLPDEDKLHLFGIGRNEWAAFVLFVNNKHVIVYNQTQSHQRINSVLMHEMAHIILGHELCEATTTEDGHLLAGKYDAVQEAEADWLGATLLLPRPALLWMHTRDMSDDKAASHFGVSAEMLTWRVRMTGVAYQTGGSAHRL